jgi:hypothetical protein
MPQIEQAIFAHIRQLSEPVDDENSEYIAGLKSAVVEALDYGIKCIEAGEDWSVPIPAGATSQARRAAREGVRLDTVLRRYAAGSRLLEEFIVVEAENLPSEGVLPDVFNAWGAQVDRLLEAVANTYSDTLALTSRSSAQKQADRIVQLLEGTSLAGPAILDYELNAWHVGLILTGDGALAAARVLAERFGSRLLEVSRDEEIVWAWLGSDRPPSMADLERLLAERMPAPVSVASGEPRQGLDGWRLTHREAQVALQVMLLRPQRLVRGSDVVLLAGMLRDPTLARVLLDSYLAPLRDEPALIDTLRAYFAAGGNAAAAAVELGVTRHTVQRRIRAVEQRLGRMLHTCQAEVEVALRIEELHSYEERNFL